MNVSDAICPLLAHALGHAERGWRVFPLRPSSKIPAVSAWESQATTDEAIIRRWWSEEPDGNVGVATGPSGLVVVDLDRPKDGDLGAEWGLTQLAELAGAHGGLEALGTLAIRTPRGGVYLVYRANGRALRNSQHKIDELIDIRAGGGYIVAAGSVVDGAPYKIVKDLPVAPLPGWLAEAADGARPGSEEADRIGCPNGTGCPNVDDRPSCVRYQDGHLWCFACKRGWYPDRATAAAAAAEGVGAAGDAAVEPPPPLPTYPVGLLPPVLQQLVAARYGRGVAGGAGRRCRARGRLGAAHARHHPPLAGPGHLGGTLDLVGAADLRLRGWEEPGSGACLRPGQAAGGGGVRGAAG